MSWGRLVLAVIAACVAVGSAFGMLVAALFWAWGWAAVLGASWVAFAAVAFLIVGPPPGGRT